MPRSNGRPETNINKQKRKKSTKLRKRPSSHNTSISESSPIIRLRISKRHTPTNLRNKQSRPRVHRMVRSCAIIDLQPKPTRQLARTKLHGKRKPTFSRPAVPSTSSAFLGVNAELTAGGSVRCVGVVGCAAGGALGVGEAVLVAW